MTHCELPWCDVNSPRPAACVGLIPLPRVSTLLVRYYVVKVFLRAEWLFERIYYPLALAWARALSGRGELCVTGHVGESPVTSKSVRRVHGQ